MLSATPALAPRPAAPASRAWLALALCLAVALIFYFENRAAYQSYFSPDDLVSLGWPTYVGNDVFIKGLLSPKLDPDNFRPVGFLYYRYLGRMFGLNYPPYLLVLQALHGLNVVLLFLLLAQLGFSRPAAFAGAVFYALDGAVMKAYWMPAFIFEALCCLLCLATLLLYLRGRWVLALIPFWLAYKSKEIAVMLPVALVACEILLAPPGKRAQPNRGQAKPPAPPWRLIPYFAISLSFGVQAIVHNRAVPATSGYVLRFTPAVLWQSVSFYSSALLLAPFAAFGLLALPLFFRDRRLYFGLIFTAALFVPMLALPTRLESVYWYVPLIGVAIAAAAVASRAKPWAIALFFVFWIPFNYAIIREKRREVIAIGDDCRWYIQALENYKRTVPPLKAVVFDSGPPRMTFGIGDAIRRVFGNDVDVVWIQSPDAKRAMNEVPMSVIKYFPVTHRVEGTLRR